MARRWALAGLITGGLAIALMTRALYARTERQEPAEGGILTVSGAGPA